MRRAVFSRFLIRLQAPDSNRFDLALFLPRCGNPFQEVVDAVPAERVPVRDTILLQPVDKALKVVRLFLTVLFE